MRKEYRRVLREAFDDGLASRLPQFAQVKVESEYFWPGNRGYRWDASGNLALWIVLAPSPLGKDEFTILLGWSARSRYPCLSVQPCIRRPDPAHGEFNECEYLTRLPSLWTKSDEWWIVRELSSPNIQSLLESMKPISDSEARCAVLPQVADAIAKLESVGLPYLRARIEYEAKSA